MSCDVLEYVDTGDLEYRERYADDRADFERFQARYAGPVDTPTGERHVPPFRSAYEEYVATGEDLMARKDELSGDSLEPLMADIRRFARLEAELDEILDEEVQPWAGRQLAGSEAYANEAIRGVYATLVALVAF